MRAEVAALLGFGAGYVLGAKAGRGRYEQLRRLYDNLLETPYVKEARDKARETAETTLEQAREAASKGASRAAEAVGIRPRRRLQVAPPIPEQPYSR